VVEPEKEGPRIVIATLVGAKGLQAAHVFVVGLNEGHPPVLNAQPTDDEVCCFLVALTRARKNCTLLSCGMFGTQRLQESVFLEWLTGLTDRIQVDAKYFKT
jgi:superfamily I DNA/RNA helicase